MCFKGKTPKIPRTRVPRVRMLVIHVAPRFGAPKTNIQYKTLVMGAKVPLITLKTGYERDMSLGQVPDWVPVPFEFCPTTQAGLDSLRSKT
jgi:hypothetical protein